METKTAQHMHEWKTGRSAKVETCYCGRFRNIVSEENPAIVEKLTQYTPGPWETSPTGPVMKSSSQPFCIFQMNEANLVAGAFGDVRGGEEVAKANAQLIAAAPELLHGLKMAVAWMRNQGINMGRMPRGIKSFEELEIAIAKAEGTK